MADAPNSVQTSPGQQPWLKSLAAHRQQFSYACFALSALFVLIPILMGIKYGSEYVTVCFWGASLATLALAAGLWQQTHQEGTLSEEDTTRLLILIAGGLAGLATVMFLGLGLTWKWWDTFTGGWEKWQGSDGWRIWVAIVSLMGGLAVMFVSLQLARGDEHTNPTLRRLLYGYNTILTGLLVLLILLVVNVLVYVPLGRHDFFNTTYRWADASIFSLSSQSEKILEALDKPVKVYAITERNNFLSRQLHALLDNCRSLTDKMQVEYLSPDQDRERVDSLMSQYKVGGERVGLLVVSGSGDKTEQRFIKYNDLWQRDLGASSGGGRNFFKGEAALMTELSFLAEGQQKPVVYFTQGQGELDLTDMQRTGQPDKGIGLAKQRLEAANYTVKGLRFSTAEGLKSKSPDIVIANQVPDDAAIIAIAGPREKFTDSGLKALREYLTPADAKKKPGKLIVLLDVTLTPEKKMVETGLEGLLAEFGVQVGNETVLHDLRSDGLHPYSIFTRFNPDDMVQRRNPIAAAFSNTAFRLYQVRPIRSHSGAGPNPGRFRADSLLIADPNYDIWAEANLEADPVELLKEYIRRKELDKKISVEPIPVAVAVSETSPSPPGGFHQPPPTEDKPRLLVFGDVTWVSNAFVGGSSTGFYDLFASCLAWLRERPSNIGIEAKKSDVYVINQSANISRMVWLPLILLGVSIIGLGTGVWVVRRR